MAITTQDGLIAALATAQHINWHKSGQRTSTAAGWHSFFDLAGGQGAGVLAGPDSGGTFSGVVPTSATPGCPPINAFGGSNTGYLAGVEYGASLSGRLMFADMLFKAGPFPTINSAQAITSPPSYSGRLPGGDAKGTQIWLEAATGWTGSALTINVGYKNQDNVSKTTGSFLTGVAPILGRMVQVPLAAGDTGVSSLESITTSGPTTGTLNLLVLRPLFTARIVTANYGGIYGPVATRMPIVFATSAIIGLMAMDSSQMPILDARLTIING
jgi:hypothetical protein